MLNEWTRLATTLSRALELAQQKSGYPEIAMLLATAQEDYARIGRAFPREQVAERVAGLRAEGKTLRAIGEEVGLRAEAVRQLLRSYDHAMQTARLRGAGAPPVTAESSLDRLDLPLVLHKVLEWREITTVGQLLALRRVDVRRLRGVGHVSVVNLERELARHGLKLAP